MKFTAVKFIFASLVLASLTACGPSLPDEVELAYDQLPDQVAYNVHVKPVLSDKCYLCNLMTGQYSQTNGVFTLNDSRHQERQYLPKEMKKLGYQTVMIGKWHLKAEPAPSDYYYVLERQGKYFDPEFQSNEHGTCPDNIVQYKGHSSDVVTDITLDWLQNKRNKERPFLLMHHFKAPHEDFEWAPRYADYLKHTFIPESDNLYNEPEFGSEATRGRNDILRHFIGPSVSDRHEVRNYVDQYGITTKPRDKATSEGYQEYLKNYLRCVKGVDDNLARIFTYLKNNNLWEPTVIIYTGDPGMMLGKHDFIDKRWMYDESMRMPSIMHYPAGTDTGTVSDLLINNTDFAPTMVELAGGKTPEYMQGKTLLETLTAVYRKIGEPKPITGHRQIKNFTIDNYGSQFNR